MSSNNIQPTPLLSGNQKPSSGNQKPSSGNQKILAFFSGLGFILSVLIIYFVVLIILRILSRILKKNTIETDEATSNTSYTKPILHWVNSYDICDGIRTDNQIEYSSIDGFEIGPSLLSWGCSKYESNMDIVVINDSVTVPKANTLTDTPTDVQGGVYVVENPSNLPLPVQTRKPILHWANSWSNCGGIPGDNVKKYSTYAGFEVGSSLVTWGCNNFNTSMDIVQIHEVVPGANTVSIPGQSLDVGTKGIYIVERPDNVPLPTNNIIENYVFDTSNSISLSPSDTLNLNSTNEYLTLGEIKTNTYVGVNRN
jgi:hypothetical protein